MRLVVLFCLALATRAHADGFYFTESLGGSDVKNELADHIPSALHFRIAVGWRTGPWAVEASLGAHIGAEESRVRADIPEWERFESLTVAGLDVKYVQPVSEHLEVYLRGGPRYGWMERGSAIANHAGRGLGAGAGVQLKGKVRALGFLAWPFFFLKIGPRVTGALWLDAGYNYFLLHEGGDLGATPAVDAEITTIAGGFAIGSDF